MIKVQTLSESIGTVAKLIVIDRQDEFEAFKALVRKGLNCWPDCHPELKALGDRIEGLEPQQDYYHTRTDKSCKSIYEEFAAAVECKLPHHPI